VSIADISAFIAAEEVRIKDKFKDRLDGVTLYASSNGYRVWAYGTGHSDRYNFHSGEGSTPDEAAERLCIEHFPMPQTRAQRLRDEARELLRKAKELEKGGGK
jgi:hypothetical protein